VEHLALVVVEPHRRLNLGPAQFRTSCRHSSIGIPGARLGRGLTAGTHPPQALETPRKHGRLELPVYDIELRLNPGQWGPLAQIRAQPER